MALPLSHQPREVARLEPAEVKPAQPKPARSKQLAGLASLVMGPAIWYMPRPDAVAAQTWHLFAIFASTIFSVAVGASPVQTAAIIALAAAVLTGTLSPADAYAGFANPTIVFIIVAMLASRAFVKCGLAL